MDDSGFPRTPDRPVKLLGTCVRNLRSIETLIGARGLDFLGGSTTLKTFLDVLDAALIHLDGAKALTPAGVASTSTNVAEGAPSP